MIKLAKAFIPAADEVWRLGHREDPECRFFRLFSEEGHYGGRTHPTDTRQGIYCCAPSGRFLASVNTTDPGAMRKMLRDALSAWKALPKRERYLAADPETQREAIRRSSDACPDDGLLLRVYSRDLPRRKEVDGWRGKAWNVDSLWFRPQEMQSLMPAQVEVDQTHPWPRELAERLVRLHLVDNVRGQTRDYRRSHLQAAEITSRITAIKGDIVTLALSGTSRASTTGTWPTDGTYESLRAPASEGAPAPTLADDERGMQTTLAGEAQFDTKRGRFVTFQLAAQGTRWGHTRYNSRHDDLDEAGIAFAIVLADEDPSARVAPSSFGAYGW